jgi:large subunit ribosomal protein L10
MKTKAQKTEQVEKGLADFKASKTVIVTDFTGLSATEVNAYRKTLRGIGAKLAVIKKRLLKILFQKENVAIDPTAFEGQTGVVFSPKDAIETSGAVFTFGKQFTKKNIFKILGGYDADEKKILSSDEVKLLGQIPPRDVLLGQLVGLLVSPIRSFMFVLKERAKKVAS